MSSVDFGEKSSSYVGSIHYRDNDDNEWKLGQCGPWLIEILLVFFFSFIISIFIVYLIRLLSSGCYKQHKDITT